MRRLTAILIPLWAALISTGSAPPNDNDRPEAPTSKSSGPGSSAPSPARMDQLLAEWEHHSARLKTLEFSIYRIDRDQDANERHFEGRVAFKTPNLAYFDLRKVKLVRDENQKMVPLLDTSKKRVSTPLDTTIWSGAEIWRYGYDTKQVFIYRLGKNRAPGQPAEAPLPLVFNVRAADVRQRFDLVLLEGNSNQHLLKITPRNPVDRSFRVAWIVLDAKTFLPSRILLLRPDKKSSEDYTLSHLLTNQPVNESYFHVVIPGKPWKIERFPRTQTHARPKGTAPRPQADARATKPVATDANQP